MISQHGAAIWKGLFPERGLQGCDRPRFGWQLGIGRIKPQSSGVHTVTQAGGCRAIVEDMAEMRSTSRAEGLGAHHPQAIVMHLAYVVRSKWLKEARPTRAGFKFGAG